MSNTDLQFQLMMEGRMNLMHLPPGAIAWLWDRPAKQIDSAETLAATAAAYSNPVIDATLLRADINVLLIKFEGGETIRVYPDGGCSFNGVPMDIGGCISVLRGGAYGTTLDDIGHVADEGFAISDNGVAIMPESNDKLPKNLSNIVTKPISEGIGENDGPGTRDGMGTGTPVVMFLSDEEIEAMLAGYTFGDFERDCTSGDMSDEDIDDIAKTIGIINY